MSANTLHKVIYSSSFIHYIILYTKYYSFYRSVLTFIIFIFFTVNIIISLNKNDCFMKKKVVGTYIKKYGVKVHILVGTLYKGFGSLIRIISLFFDSLKYLYFLLIVENSFAKCSSKICAL